MFVLAIIEFSLVVLSVVLDISKPTMILCISGFISCAVSYIIVNKTNADLETANRDLKHGEDLKQKLINREKVILVPITDYTRKTIMNAFVCNLSKDAIYAYMILNKEKNHYTIYAIREKSSSIFIESASNDDKNIDSVKIVIESVLNSDIGHKMIYFAVNRMDCMEALACIELGLRIDSLTNPNYLAVFACERIYDMDEKKWKIP